MFEHFTDERDCNRFGSDLRTVLKYKLYFGGQLALCEPVGVSPAGQAFWWEMAQTFCRSTPL